MRRGLALVLVLAALAAALCPPALAACCLRGEWSACRDDDCGPPDDCCRTQPAPDVAHAPDAHADVVPDLSVHDVAPLPAPCLDTPARVAAIASTVERPPRPPDPAAAPGTLRV